MWKTKSQLKDQLIESLMRENAALRALCSKCGVTLPDSGGPSVPSRRSTTKVTESSVFVASRETRLADQIRRESASSDPQPVSSVPNENSNA